MHGLVCWSQDRRALPFYVSDGNIARLNRTRRLRSKQI